MVSEPDMVTLSNWTPILEWYMASLVLKNKHSKNTCCNEIGMYAQNLDTMVGSTVKAIERTMQSMKRTMLSTFT